jgi:replicative DNA helicase
MRTERQDRTKSSVHFSALVEPPVPLASVIGELDQRIRGSLARTLRPVAIGLDPITAYLGGGFHPEELVLIGGMQGVGKTTAVLQMARSVALQNRLAIIVCYEHSRLVLLYRMLCMESFWSKGNRLTWPKLRDTIVAFKDDPERCFDRVLLALPEAAEAWDRLAGYMEGIWVVHGHSVYFNTREIENCVKRALEQGYAAPVLFVDYLQKVPVRPDELGYVPSTEQRIEVVMAELDNLADRYHCVVVAVAAADAEALRRQRVHLENLWGPANVQYDPDTALILNRGTGSASEGIKSVRWAIEKQRNGPQMIEFEVELHGPHFCFNPAGRLVSEEESFQGERIELKPRRVVAQRVQPMAGGDGPERAAVLACRGGEPEAGAWNGAGGHHGG